MTALEQGLVRSRSMQLAEPGCARALLAAKSFKQPFADPAVPKQRSGRLVVPSRRSALNTDESQAQTSNALKGLEHSFSQAASDAGLHSGDNGSEAAPSAAKRRRASKARHQLTYKISAISASLGVTALAVAAVHYRYAWHVRNGGEVPWVEAVCTILLVFGGVVGMEMWARWAHKALWHDFHPGWALHKSHHAPRLGPFEANDIFAVVNAVPAIGLCGYGFLTPTIFGGICFGAGLGITLFGMMYMFVHDGLVHRRFPVGPLADVPYLKRVAAAHKLHHAERFDGVPWGLFLGPQELEAVGGKKELEYMCRSQAELKK